MEYYDAAILEFQQGAWSFQVSEQLFSLTGFSRYPEFFRIIAPIDSSAWLSTGDRVNIFIFPTPPGPINIENPLTFTQGYLRSIYFLNTPLEPTTGSLSAILSYLTHCNANILSCRSIDSGEHEPGKLLVSFVAENLLGSDLEDEELSVAFRKDLASHLKCSEERLAELEIRRPATKIAATLPPTMVLERVTYLSLFHNPLVNNPQSPLNPPDAVLGTRNELVEQQMDEAEAFIEPPPIRILLGKVDKHLVTIDHNNHLSLRFNFESRILQATSRHHSEANLRLTCKLPHRAGSLEATVSPLASLNVNLRLVKPRPSLARESSGRTSQRSEHEWYEIIGNIRDSKLGLFDLQSISTLINASVLEGQLSRGIELPKAIERPVQESELTGPNRTMEGFSHSIIMCETVCYNGNSSQAGASTPLITRAGETFKCLSIHTARDKTIALSVAIDTTQAAEIDRNIREDTIRHALKTSGNRLKTFKRRYGYNNVSDLLPKLLYCTFLQEYSDSIYGLYLSHQLYRLGQEITNFDAEGRMASGQAPDPNLTSLLFLTGEPNKSFYRRWGAIAKVQQHKKSVLFEPTRKSSGLTHMAKNFFRQFHLVGTALRSLKGGNESDSANLARAKDAMRELVPIVFESGGQGGGDVHTKMQEGYKALSEGESSDASSSA